VKNVQQKVEKATLGDLGVLAELKKKMESGDAGTTEEPKSE
jgi:small subunit ribosomal protein S1